MRFFLDREQISQSQLADRAQVSQSTVSRALARTPGRRARAHGQLIEFIHEQSGVPTPTPTTVAAAVEEVWDGTEAHEAALASLIVASAALWPRMEGGG